jgi:hypothetical protein
VYNFADLGMKVKVKSVIKDCSMKTGTSGVVAVLFLNSALNEWSALRLGRFIPGMHWMGD